MTDKKSIAILQSSYIPWKGYFDIIHDVDTFIFYDDVQFTYQDWRSRNRIVTPNGPLWLTVPTGSDIDRLIHEVEIKDGRWQAKHWRSIQQSYARAPCFPLYKDRLESVYLGRTWTSLSELNQELIKMISRDILGITTEFRDSREYNATGKKLDRLVDLVVKSGASTYVSGPSAASYIDADRFAAIGTSLVYKDYGGYPEYPQKHAPFLHDVSILDLLFNVGDAAQDFIWGWRDTSRAPAGVQAAP
ncbi:MULTISPECIES: WbqC family protein [Luteimonas]|uniref:WbqC family protein n=1 Tax=Luteimonas TaxID=83614 RepID=UPI000C7BE50B|nr:MULTISPECIES: WbqC family protein [Luteimonas]